MTGEAQAILTTHAGSLPRPPEVLDLLRSRQLASAEGREILSNAVRRVVRQQVEAGVDIVSDGEFGKTGFFGYVTSRLSGLETVVSEPRPSERTIDTDPNFPDFGDWLRARRGQAITTPAAPRRTVCSGPVGWQGQSDLDASIGILKTAIVEARAPAGFMTAASPGLISRRMENRFYPRYEEYLQDVAAALSHEYRSIAGAGLVLQIDAPEMAIDRNHLEFRERPLAYFRSRLELWVEALNYALKDVPQNRVRLHVCWGNSEAPHTGDVPLADIVDIVLRARVGAFSIEASNPRHAHEWRVWQDVKLPAGARLVPGVIDTTTNFVEHPRLVADRIVRYAGIICRENVIAGTDCGFGTAATEQAVHPGVVWAKLRALSEGARIATAELSG